MSLASVIAIRDAVFTLPPPGIPLTVQPGAPITVRLMKIEDQSLDIITRKQVDDILVLAKGVLFEMWDPADAQIKNQLDSIFGTLPPVLPRNENTPGVASRIVGNTIESIPTPVSFEIQWWVEDSSGNRLTPGVDYLAPLGLSQVQATFIFVPDVVELTSLDQLDPASASAQALPVKSVKIQVRIRLRAGNLQTGWRDLPAIPVAIVALPVPTLFVYFTDRRFQGSLCAWVPSKSPIPDIQVLQTTLATIGSKVSTLQSTSRFALFLAGLSVIGNAIPQTWSLFRKRDRQSDLEEDKFYTRGFWGSLGLGSLDGDNNVRSIILIGAPGKRVELYIDSWYKTDEGKYTLRIVWKPIALVRDLDTRTPVSEPDGNELTTQVAPNEDDGRYHFVDSIALV